MKYKKSLTLKLKGIPDEKESESDRNHDGKDDGLIQLEADK